MSVFTYVFIKVECARLTYVKLYKKTIISFVWGSFKVIVSQILIKTCIACIMLQKLIFDYFDEFCYMEMFSFMYSVSALRITSPSPFSHEKMGSGLIL